MYKLVLSTGSNLGDRRNNLEAAAGLLKERIGKLIRSSTIFESPAWGYESRNKYYNQCLIIETDLGPDDCLGLMLGIEQKLGRTRKNGVCTDRIIDIDILFYDDLVLDSVSLKIPHERMAERKFILLPLAEILPDFVHPVLFRTVSELLEACPDELEVVPVKA